MEDPVDGLVISDMEVWRGEYCVCANWNVHLRMGQLLQLRGGNGAGKTSLIRVFAGLAWPEQGAIVYGAGRWSPRAPAYRGQLRYLAHRDGVKQELTAEENLRLSARLLADQNAVDGVEKALERVGLGGLGMRRAAELSAGQRRRLALARLLLGHGRLWLLDEPLVSLDHTGVALVAELLREHLRDGGLAVVATHQPLAIEGLDVIAVDLPARTAHVH